MTAFFASLGSLFTGGAATGAAATTATTTVGAAATTGISFSTILQGGLGLLTAVSQISAGNAEADAYEAQAIDAKREQPLETLQGISRRASIKRQMAESVGDQDVAYAASGTDLSFGTPAVARREAFREGDTALTADAGTEMTRASRLAEKEANYRKLASKARKSGKFDAFTTIAGTGLKIADNWG